jgi:hypothetical protein
VKKILVIIIGVLFYNFSFSQSCLPDGITFETQAQIDSFSINYPNCTEIEGNVNISNSNITNLTGLNVLTSIYGDFNIYNNDLLPSLTGLHNITTIGGDLYIEENAELTSLSGLDNLTYIGGSTKIYRNDTLLNLAGLNNVDSIGDYLAIIVNKNLTSLTGLDNLTTIGGYLSISWNPSLISLMGLHNLTSIGFDSDLFITQDNLLTSLNGLEGLTSIGSDLGIQENASLTCLSGLNNVTYIGNTFLLGGFDEGQGNPSLISLTGLEGLTSIGYLEINDNSALTSLIGLDNLTSIGGNLLIGTWPAGNSGLKSLTGLESLIYIGDALEVGYNDSLTSLTGLDNVEANTLSDLYIYGNSSLSTCAVQSICDYLAAPNGTVEIHDNAIGCNSEVEVDSACVYLSNGNAYDLLSFLIYPNPTSTKINIEVPFNPSDYRNTTLVILNSCEQQLLVRQILQPHLVLDVSELSNGIYFLKIISQGCVLVKKFVKN